jgi:hypothetical protein
MSQPSRSCRDDLNRVQSRPGLKRRQSTGYDYAGQDPINGYDLSGTLCIGKVCAHTPKVLKKAAKKLGSIATKAGASVVVSTVGGPAATIADIASSGALSKATISAAKRGVHHREDILTFAAGCWAGGSWGAEWGSLTAAPGGTAAGAIGGCLFGGGSAVLGADILFPDWHR